MTDRIRIKQYEQAADEKVSIGGIKWQRKWDVCIQCDSREEAEALRRDFIRKEKDKAWAKIDLTKCTCDHNEYCINCFPEDFRKGGYWERLENGQTALQRLNKAAEDNGEEL